MEHNNAQRPCVRSLFLPILSTDVHCLVQLRKMHAERRQPELVSGCLFIIIIEIHNR